MRERKKLQPLSIINATDTFVYNVAYNFNHTPSTRHIALLGLTEFDKVYPSHWARLRQSTLSKEGNRTCKHVYPEGTIVINHDAPVAGLHSSQPYCLGCVYLGGKYFYVPKGAEAVFVDNAGITVVRNRLNSYQDKYSERIAGHAIAVSAQFTQVTRPNDPDYHWVLGGGSIQYTNCDPVPFTQLDFSTSNPEKDFRKVPQLLESAIWHLSSMIRTSDNDHTIKLSTRSFTNPYYREGANEGWATCLDKTFIMLNRLKPYPDDFKQLFIDSFGATRRFSGNLIAYVLEGKEMLESRELSSLSALQNFLQNKNTANAASMWLSGRYAERLTIADTQELLEAVKKLINPVSTSIHESIRNTARSSHIGDFVRLPEGGPDLSGYASCTTYVTPKDRNVFEKGMRTIMEWDAYCTLENMWDLIPYSFVVDWFVQVGPALEKLDELIRLQYYNVEEVLYTQKFLMSDEELPLITWHYYNRQVEHTLPELSFEVEYGHPNWIQTVDAVSLITQRLRL